MDNQISIIEKNFNLIIVGGEPFYRKEAKDFLLKRFCLSCFDVSISSPTCDDLKRECFSNSLFGKFKLIHVDNFSYKKDMEDFFVKLSSLKNDKFVLFIEECDCEKLESLKKKLNDTVDKNTFLFLNGNMKPKEKVKLLKQYSVDIGINSNPVSDFRLDLEAAELLLNLCDDDFSIAYQELIKLNLLFGCEVKKQDIILFVTPVGGSKDVIQLYVSLMSGNSVNSVMIAREVNKNDGSEIVLGTLVRLSYLMLLLSYVDGNDKVLLDFLKKKRTPIDVKWASEDSAETSVKSNVPSPFVMRTAKKLYDRVGGRSFCGSLFTQCYDSYVKYRMSANESEASAVIDKIICLICRS